MLAQNALPRKQVANLTGLSLEEINGLASAN